MRSFVEFLKTTCIGGFFIILPIGLLIIILMIKPYGLFGTKDIERV